MFEDLVNWPRILVTGPQRSGTRICTQMIAQDTGHWFVGEEEFGVDSLNRLWRLLQTSRNLVIQCPTMSPFVSLLAVDDEGLLVVMMARNLKDIKASEKRIDWRWETPELIRCLELGGDQAKIKYSLWRGFQRECLGPQAYEVEYESLSAHPLWIPKKDRARFAPRQTA